MLRVSPQARSGKKGRRSRRFEIERLEDRLAPAGLDFVPIAAVSVNPQPLPPSALVEFDPLLQMSTIPATAQSIKSPIHVQGHFAESGQITEPAAAAAPISWSLEVFYTLAGQASENLLPQGPTGQQSTIKASYKAAGQMVTALTIEGAGGTQQTLQIDGITVQGSLDGTIPPTDPVVKKHVMNVKYENITVVTGVTFSPSFGSWLRQTRSDSSGTVVETEQPATVGGTGVSLAASFSQRDGITTCLMPLTPIGHPPNPCYQIDGVWSAAGSVTENLVSPGPPVVLAGPVQYEGGISETITSPSTAAGGGVTQSLTQDSMNNGNYRNVEFDPGL
jgi:hypothetical protein